jgi:hypothetical protein
LVSNLDFWSILVDLEYLFDDLEILGASNDVCFMIHIKRVKGLEPASLAWKARVIVDVDSSFETYIIQNRT